MEYAGDAPNALLCLLNVGERHHDMIQVPAGRFLGAPPAALLRAV